MADYAEYSDDFAAIPLIDEARLSKMRSIMPGGAFRAIVHSFIASEFFAALQVASPTPNDALAGLLHDCKGTSANMGALRLRALAERLEMACRARDTAALVALLPLFDQVTGLTRAALAALVA